MGLEARCTPLHVVEVLAFACADALQFVRGLLVGDRGGVVEPFFQGGGAVGGAVYTFVLEEIEDVAGEGEVGLLG